MSTFDARPVPATTTSSVDHAGWENWTRSIRRPTRHARLDDASTRPTVANAERLSTALQDFNLEMQRASNPCLAGLALREHGGATLVLLRPGTAAQPLLNGANVMRTPFSSVRAALIAATAMPEPANN